MGGRLGQDERHGAIYGKKGFIKGDEEGSATLS